MKNQETLALMLAAEQRDCPWAELTLRNALKPEEVKYDPFDDCVTVAEAVKLKIDFDETCYGEIDPVDQDHYLRGPNVWDEESLALMEWEAKTEEANR